MFRFVIALVLFCVFPAAPTAIPCPECYMTTPQLIDLNGFPVESHFTTTEDGYILNIFRIPPRHPGSPVVFFQHGLVASSDTWLLNRRWGSFPFILAEQGYDVWLGNVRGNVYNLNHTTLSSDSAEFWDFSFQEMAELDLPAMLDHVLKTSQQDKLFYIGHSQGTQMAFIEFSQNKVLAEKIHLVVALAPIARVSHVKGLLGYLSYFEFLLDPMYDLFGNRQIATSSYATKVFATMICPVFAIVEHLCQDMGSLLTGFDNSNVNQTRYHIYKAHSSQSTSTKDIVHWAQLNKAQRIQKFDYESPEANMAHYNQTTPPQYDISRYSVPTVLVAGGNDWLADSRDVLWLSTTIRDHIRNIIFVDKYNHGDYVTGMDAAQLVYFPVIKNIEEILAEIH